jgi:hypothetical protein
MSISHKLDLLLAEVRDLREELKSDPRHRVSPYTVKELAQLARRHTNYISARCRAGLIPTLGGKPYRISPGAAAKFLGLT